MKIPRALLAGQADKLEDRDAQAVVATPLVPLYEAVDSEFLKQTVDGTHRHVKRARQATDTDSVRVIAHSP
jgi:hypothetical protein